ncbi:MAG: TolC family protein [Prolixibacteraceae bacterium]
MIKQRLQTTLFLFIIILGQLSAQTYDDLVANSISGKDITMRLPPIAELQAAALETSPLLKIHDANLVISRLKIISMKRDWMRSLGFEAGAKYGLFDNLILTGDLGIDQVATNTTEQTRYNVGLFLKIPLSTVVDKSSVNIARAEMDIIALEKETTIRELRNLIIVQYNNVVKAYRNMVIQNNAVEIYRVQMLRAEQDFNNGKITVADYARLHDMLSRSILNFEDIKVEYITALQLLQETVGIEIKLEN